MALELRNSGIDVVGDIPWSTHYCYFYETGSARHYDPLFQGWIGKQRVLPVGGLTIYLASKTAKARVK